MRQVLHTPPEPLFCGQCGSSDETCELVSYHGGPLARCCERCDHHHQRGDWESATGPLPAPEPVVMVVVDGVRYRADEAPGEGASAP